MAKRLFPLLTRIGAFEHRNLVRLVDWGETRWENRDLFFYSEEFLEGRSLGLIMEEDRAGVPLIELGPAILGALDGLAYIHGRGEVHGSVHPGNVIVCDGGPKLTDCGVLSWIRRDLASMDDDGDYFEDPSLKGGFFSPDLLLNRNCGPGEDVFAMGASMYYCLTGLSIYPGPDYISAALKRRIIPVRDRLPGLPEALAGVIDRSVSPEPGDRFKSACEMREALAGALEAPRARKPGKPARILVVDDEEAVLSLVADLMRHEGHEVFCAPSVVEGMRLARRHKPDLVITDLVMPGSPGYDLIAGLYRHPDTYAVPVLALTADGELVLAKQGDERGLHSLSSNIAAYMTKPFSAVELRAVVDAILAAARAGKLRPGEPYYKVVGNPKRPRRRDE